MAIMKNSITTRSIVIAFATVLWFPSHGAKTDTTVVNLKARVVALEQKVARAKADSMELVQVNTTIAALEKKVDYLSQGNDSAINVAWAALGIVTAVVLALLAVNWFTNFRVIPSKLESGIAGLKKYVDETMEARIAEKTDPEFEYIRKLLVRCELIALEAEMAVRKREAVQPYQFYDDKFGKQLKWLSVAMEMQKLVPQLDMSDALEGMVLFLKEHKLSLYDRTRLEEILVGFNEKSAIHVAAVRAAIQPIDGPFL